jgi:hypothetical protein
MSCCTKEEAGKEASQYLGGASYLPFPPMRWPDVDHLRFRIDPCPQITTAWKRNQRARVISD